MGGAGQAGAGGGSGGLTSFLSGSSDASAVGGVEAGPSGSGDGAAKDRKHADLRLAFDMLQVRMLQAPMSHTYVVVIYIDSGSR